LKKQNTYQLTENTTRQFEWDGTNRLISFKNQVGTSEPTVIAQYLYDSSGNRVKKIVRKQGGSYEIRTYIDGVFEYYTDEIDEQNTIYVMDASTSSAPSRVASIRIGASMGDSTPAIKYNLENNIYSSTVVLDDTGTIVNSQEYYPFGETSFGSYAKKRYQYVGKERDEESGLYYYGARYYMAYACRFISVDKLAANYMQLTPYQNAGNNPINDYDIDGNQGGKTPTTVEINYPEGSITTTKNEHGQYQVTQAQLDAIGPFGTNWNDDRSTDSSTIKLEPGGELDVVCDKCNHGIDSYVTIHIPKQASVDTGNTNMAFTSTETSSTQAPPTVPNQPTSTTGILASPKGQVSIGNNVVAPGGNLWIGLNAQFSAGNANLTNKSEIEGAINNIANALKANPKNTFTIFGSVLMRAADNWDSPVPANTNLSNRQLATQRTQAIANLLIKQGVDPSQINQRIGVKTAQRVNGNFQNNAPAK
jgi:RHS repeat-associated protein